MHRFTVSLLSTIKIQKNLRLWTIQSTDRANDVLRTMKLQPNNKTIFFSNSRYVQFLFVLFYREKIEVKICTFRKQYGSCRKCVDNKGQKLWIVLFKNLIFKTFSIEFWAWPLLHWVNVKIWTRSEYSHNIPGVFHFVKLMEKAVFFLHKQYKTQDDKNNQWNNWRVS